MWKLAGLLAILVLLAPSAARSQGTVLQSGPMVPGHLAKFIANGVIADSGIPSDAGVVNITAITPIVVDPDPITQEGVISHANSGVTAGSYTRATITVNATGHVTAAADGGTGVSITALAPVVVTPSPIVDTGIISLLGCGLTTLGFTDCTQTWTAVQTFRGAVGSIGNASGGNPEGNVITGTTYTLNSGSQTDCGRDLIFTSNSDVTLTTDPAAPVGCHISLTQAGLGTITIVDGGGATHVSRLNFTATAGQYALLGLGVYQNSGGSAAVYLLSGDGQ